MATDVTQVRRFATGLDVPNPAFNEHERADCAPRSTLGDGSINSGDVVQARRYATGLDTLTDGGGPSTRSIVTAGLSELIDIFSRYASDREIRIGKAEYFESTITVPVELTAVGDEAAVSFTLEYDASLMWNPRVLRGGSLSEDAVLTVNLDESGRIRVLVDSAAALVVAKGSTILVVATFDVVTNADRPVAGSFSGKIAANSVSDAEGNLVVGRTGSE